MSSDKEQNLFSDEFYKPITEREIIGKPKKGKFKKIKIEIKYRKTTTKENCSNCKNSYISAGNSRNYRKCKLISTSNSEASDVSRNFICDKYHA